MAWLDLFNTSGSRQDHFPTCSTAQLSSQGRRRGMCYDCRHAIPISRLATQSPIARAFLVLACCKDACRPVAPVTWRLPTLTFTPDPAFATCSTGQAQVRVIYAAYPQDALVLQCEERRAVRPGGRPGAHPGSHRLFHHRRARSQGGALRLLLHRRGDRLRRR